MADNPERIGERIASLEARFEGFQLRFDNFQSQMTVNQAQIMAKLDKIEESFEERKEKVNTRFSELDKKAPAIIQQIVLVLATGMVMGIVSYLIGKIP